ncbi:TRAP transporter, 4TM/12TM fusion protein [Alkaliphilus metalliredigens QYMF]|uniref:TRAP transporter, 4TM/12TM fusion protein n=1 Tax=Alkaliphilus metalliredigens (strain QYMF) TaxID=293826 RepID=A6TJU8_ALKMQ|nr:TRAP transporter fused permease subunit [Alkaliphilus metalliredigens]ABR46466.1 TRAP transporter, 4TM/12TM fusion protein [Alkaliphilus metalliredigens QYMF]
MDKQIASNSLMEKLIAIGWRKIAIVMVTVTFFAFQMYLAFIRPLQPLMQNPLHFILALAIAILYYPVVKKTKDDELPKWKKMLPIIDMIILASLIFMAYYYMTNEYRIVHRIQNIDPLITMDYVIMFMTVGILLECVRRILGANLLIFIFLFIGYAWLGPYMPTVISHSGFTLRRFTELMVMGTGGVYGAPLNASAGFLYYFIIFGALFADCGSESVLMDIGMKAGSKGSGGPAKAAILSSGLLGMINGSAVANVSTTGVMTIPMMKRIGYKSHEAGAIEAVASTGGQIMPPIMGVGAFIMAEMIGVPYGQIALAATIPALAYFGSLFILVDLLARKRQISGEHVAEEIKTEPILKRLYLLIPILLVVIFIVRGASLMRSALIGTAAIIVINILRGKNGLSAKELINSFFKGTKQVAEIAVPTASSGIIIGIVVMSGLANKLAAIISSVGGNNMAFALVITTLGCMVLGMALPTVAAYLAAYILFMPSLINLGIPSLPANMFIFYFGIIAQITPPVCLASFAAAGIAEASAWKTGWTAFRYALVAFLVPFVFVYKPEILLMGTVMDTILATIVLFIGTFFLASAIAGHLFIPLNTKLKRYSLLICAIMVILPEPLTSMIGIVAGIAIATVYFKSSKKITEVTVSGT